MTAMASDPWLVTNSRNMSPQRLHAIGVLTLRWNNCELWLFHLFRYVSGLSDADAWALVHDLGDMSICTPIKTLADNRQFHSDGRSLIANVLEVYDITRQNRNAVVHAWTLTNFGAEDELLKKSKRPDDFSSSPIESDLAALRRVAEEMELLHINMWLICITIEDGTIAGPLSSPHKLPLPGALWKPHPQAHTKSKRRLKSFQP